jgi:hypothetical protein
MSQHGRWGSGSSSSSRYGAGSSSTPRYTHTSSSTPRYMPPDRYEPSTSYGASASSGTGQMSHYQLSSSHRGQVTNTDHRCSVAYYTWACRCETSEIRRHRLCYECNSLDTGSCNPEPMHIDKTSKCASCKADREEKRRREDQERAAARDRKRRRDWKRERSPSRERVWERRRSY